MYFVRRFQWKYNKDKLPVTDVKLDLFLSRVLRAHQQEGVLFLYTCVTGMRNVKYNGAILADEMGLGKTLQCICLIWYAYSACIVCCWKYGRVANVFDFRVLLKSGPYGGVPLVQRVLIVTPSSLANNWLKEFKRWLGFERLQPFVVNQVKLFYGILDILEFLLNIYQLNENIRVTLLTFYVTPVILYRSPVTL